MNVYRMAVSAITDVASTQMAVSTVCVMQDFMLRVMGRTVKVIQCNNNYSIIVSFPYSIAVSVSKVFNKAKSNIE